ncbi:MAG: polysaccharide deacetylase family protein [Syntrophomonas sp.]
MDFEITCPDTYLNERQYIIKIIMSDFMGLTYNIKFERRETVSIKLRSSDKELVIEDILFLTPQYQWLKPTSLPKQPLEVWNINEINTDNNLKVIESSIPIIYGRKIIKNEALTQNMGYLTIDEQNIHLGMDVFGSAFFMLTRYEEYVKVDRDQHGRFPSRASLAYQEGFLERPIINEYVEILWWCMKRLWPELKRKKHYFQIIAGHDVDVPFVQAFKGISQLIRNCGGDILIRKSPSITIKRIKSWKSIKKGDYKKDLNYTFDLIMDVSELNNLRSAFYFKTGCTNPDYDDDYSIEHPYIRQLLRDIHNRGHEIGLHPSYETFNNPKQTKIEFKKLLQVCEEEGIEQNSWGGRQHYLRWQVPVTWRNWAEAGLNYDSTLLYADQAGFRCGVCYEFQVYDLEQGKTLSINERPLIIMDTSLLSEQYMDLQPTQALQCMIKFKNRCQQFGGDFTVVWHNNSFIEKHSLGLFKEIVLQK